MSHGPEPVTRAAQDLESPKTKDAPCQVPSFGGRWWAV